MDRRRTLLGISLALALGTALVLAGAASAEDWPTYRHDAARSGVTSDQVVPPLSEQWAFRSRQAPQPAWGPPKTGPVEGILELPRVQFDDAFHVAAAGGLALFGSSADNKVYALDVATGEVRWAFFTGGPVRLAPTVWKDRVLAASDDGFVYCLRASDGGLVWRFRAAVVDRKVLGSGRMISLCPVRTGVLVDGGVAYFAAGIFPAEGVAFYAVNAEDGELVWKNDWIADETRSSLSPQGYLLASASTLFAPMGRVSPAAFDRKDGRFLYFPFLGKEVGGTYALLADSLLYTGTEQVVAYQQATPRQQFAWFPARKLVVTKDVSYAATGKVLTAFDRTTYPKASLARRSLLARRGAVAADIPVIRRDRDKAAAALEAAADANARASKQKALDAAARNIEKAQADLNALDDQLKTNTEAVRDATKWNVPCDCADSLILAGGVLFAGGKGKVAAIEAATGETLWTGKVDGVARGLAAAGGQLFASTDKGVIHCFGKAAAAASKAVAQAAAESPYPRDELTPVYAAAAETIVRETGITRGYCLVLGCGTGRLARELARRTELTIYGVDPDPAKVEAARTALDAAGLYGTRVTVDQSPLGRVPYADYFANLVVCDWTVATGVLPASAGEMLRMLKPCGGVALIGQPEPAQSISRRTLADWLRAGGIRDWDLVRAGGLWAKVVRGPLEGAGKWTHQYGEPGNTACGDDQLVRCPLGILWFGEPGPASMVNRHAGAVGPLSRDGRLFIQGENLVMAYDAYNGLKLWQRDIPGAMRAGTSRESSNLALGDDGLFVAVKGKCLRLDLATGETRAIYDLPPSLDGKPRRWGYVATVGDLLFGSATAKGLNCDLLFAIDLGTGEPKWVHRGTSISQITIAIGEGRVFFAEAAVSPEQRAEALAGKLEAARKLEGKERDAALKRLDAADVRLVTALDVRTGSARWAKPIEVSDCERISKGGGELICMVHDGALVFCAASTDGHFWRDFFEGQFAQRTVVVLSARNGSLLWAKPIGYRHRPLIVGDTLVAEPWAFDLKTGSLKMRTSPLTGESAPWQFARPGHHCGPVAASPTTLFFRSWTLGYYDLVQDTGTLHFGAIRPGCWINFIPANGLLMVPEASAGCMCAFPNMCTVVLQPRAESNAWGMFSVFQPGKEQRSWAMDTMAKAAKPSVSPIRSLAINLGAPGDRRASDGTLWFGYPRPRGSLVFQVDLKARMLRKGGYYRTNAESAGIEGTDLPWVFASGCRGLARCGLPLVGKDEQPGIYTVRLGFVEPDNDGPGQRVFDIRLQGKAAQKDFDIFAAAGRNRAVVREFPGVSVSRSLIVELVQKGGEPLPEHAPILNSIEVRRTQSLRFAVVPPTFHVGDVQPEQTQEVTIVSHADRDFVGRLEAGSTDAVVLEPALTAVQLAPGETRTFQLKATARKGVVAGDYSLPLRLVGPQAVEAEANAVVSHVGDRREVTLDAVEDAFTRKREGKRNFGTDQEMWVDGGDKAMGDGDNGRIYIKFRLDVPGRPKSAKVRLHVGTWAAAESGDSGRICLVEGEWDEGTLTYENQPEPGRELAKIGRIAEGDVVERAIDVPLEGRKELSIVLVPTSTDGAGYCSRESQDPPELVVELGE